MGTITVRLAKWAIKASAGTRFAGTGCGFGADEVQLASTAPDERYRQALLEAEDAGRFLEMFGGIPLKGQRVLDFGCGYGGKTVEYARQAAFAAGIEPFPIMISLAREYGKWAHSSNVLFEVCPQDRIPFEDDSFDVVLSHDVLEHVDDPKVSLEEIHRVLKPGGKAYLVFPVYLGAMSHHLDYVSKFPGLHWFFSADTLVAAVNDMHRSDIPEQPAPKKRWWGDTKVLPMLNGLSGPEFRQIASSMFIVERLDQNLIGAGGSSLAAKLFYWLASKPLSLSRGVARDLVTSNICAILRKG
ncbi:MAG TPA: class I SAM-dependent methyltransferase [Bryobacteraceae bacterium]|nr:class I SAM-dependent methyltransferase [Bryobacteraceae bacterium]